MYGSLLILSSCSMSPLAFDFGRVFQSEYEEPCECEQVDEYQHEWEISGARVWVAEWLQRVVWSKYDHESRGLKNFLPAAGPTNRPGPAFHDVRGITVTCCHTNPFTNVLNLRCRRLPRPRLNQLRKQKKQLSKSFLRLLRCTDIPSASWSRLTFCSNYYLHT